jgi:hypothetical protein
MVEEIKGLIFRPEICPSWRTGTGTIPTSGYYLQSPSAHAISNASMLDLANLASYTALSNLARQMSIRTVRVPFGKAPSLVQCTTSRGTVACRQPLPTFPPSWNPRSQPMSVALFWSHKDLQPLSCEAFRGGPAFMWYGRDHIGPILEFGWFSPPTPGLVPTRARSLCYTWKVTSRCGRMPCRRDAFGGLDLRFWVSVSGTTIIVVVYHAHDLYCWPVSSYCVEQWESEALNIRPKVVGGSSCPDGLIRVTLTITWTAFARVASVASVASNMA